MSTVIGIDLGTSTTEAAIIRDGKPQMLMNLEGQIITPSFIGLDASGNWVVGEKARAQYLLAPERTAMEVKRSIGGKEEITLGDKSYSPQDLSAKLLEYVRQYASTAAGEVITHAVISVPAYFTDVQRQIVVAAGKQAGFSVERILNEPTAAALSYGLEHMDDESHILVYDLGGGTFDVTLLEMFAGVLEVKASNGDNKLGGKDFDQCLIDHILEGFKRAHGVDLKDDKSAMAKIKDAAEKCKKALSTEPSYHVVLPAIAMKGGKPLAIDQTITVEQFEEWTAPLIRRTHDPIDIVMSDAGIGFEDLDKIILVGGSTRMPMVARDIEAFTGIRPEAAVNPDYAVAEGAAIQAGIIDGSIRPEDSLVMTDVCSYSLGIQCTGYNSQGFTHNMMSIIIPRNTTIPVTREETYTTFTPFQDAADIKVYQGESDVASHNHLLGRFQISGLRPMAQQQPILVSFTYNLNGILEVVASAPESNRGENLQINMLNDTYEAENDDDEGDDDWDDEDDWDDDEDWDEDDEDDDEDEDEDEDEYDDEFLETWKEKPLGKGYRATIRNAERILDTDLLDDDQADDLIDLLHDIKVSIIRDDKLSADDFESDILDLLDEAGV